MNEIRIKRKLYSKNLDFSRLEKKGITCLKRPIHTREEQNEKIQEPRQLKEEKKQFMDEEEDADKEWILKGLEMMEFNWQAPGLQHSFQIGALSITEAMNIIDKYNLRDVINEQLEREKVEYEEFKSQLQKNQENERKRLEELYKKGQEDKKQMELQISMAEDANCLSEVKEMIEDGRLNNTFPYAEGEVIILTIAKRDNGFLYVEWDITDNEDRRKEKEEKRKTSCYLKNHRRRWNKEYEDE